MSERIEVGVVIKGADKATKSLTTLDKEAKGLGSSFGAVSQGLDKFTGGAVTGFKNAASGIKTFIKGLKLTRVAIISTGIGAIVLAVVALVSAFASTNKNAKKIKVVFAALGAVVERVTGYLRAMGGFLVGLFSGGVQEGLANYRGEMDKLPGSMQDAIDKAMELERRTQSLRTAQRDLSIEFAEGRAQIKEYNMVAEDVTRSLEDRLEAAQKAIDIEKELMTERQRIAQEDFDIAQQKAAQSDTSEDDLDSLRDKEVALINIRTESAEMQTTLNNKINIIRQQATSAAKAEADAFKAAEKKKQDAIEETEKKEAERIKGILAKAEEARSFTLKGKAKELFDLEMHFLSLEEAQLDYIDHIEENELLFQEGELERAQDHLVRMEEEFEIRKVEMEEKYAQASIDIANAEAEAVRQSQAEIRDARIAGVQAALSAISAIQQGNTNAANADAIRRRNNNMATAKSDEERIKIDEKLEREQLAIKLQGERNSRKLAIANVLLSQGQAIASAIAGAQASAAGTGTAAVVTSPVFTATMIGIVLGGFAQIKGIMNQAGADLPALDDVSTGGGGGGGSSSAGAGTSGQTQLALTPDVAGTFDAGTLELPAVQAYVLQNDIASAAALQQELENRASL